MKFYKKELQGGFPPKKSQDDRKIGIISQHAYHQIELIVAHVRVYIMKRIGMMFAAL